MVERIVEASLGVLVSYMLFVVSIAAKCGFCLFASLALILLLIYRGVRGKERRV